MAAERDLDLFEVRDRPAVSPYADARPLLHGRIAVAAGFR